MKVEDIQTGVAYAVDFGAPGPERVVFRSTQLEDGLLVEHHPSTGEPVRSIDPGQVIDRLARYEAERWLAIQEERARRELRERLDAEEDAWDDDEDGDA